MRQSIDLVREAFKFGNPERLPRGELWINSEVLQKAQLNDNLEGHLTLRRRLGMDLLALPFAEEPGETLSQGYGYFNLDDVREAASHSGLFVMVVLDGPFQKLTSREGLGVVLRNWKESREALREKCRKEGAAVGRVVEPCLRAGIEAFVLADDVAYEQSTYFSPKDFGETLQPFYSTAVEGIHAGGGRVLFHSCGNFRGFMRQLLLSGFDGFAGCQTRFLERGSAPGERHTVVLGGIEPEHLEPRTFDSAQQRNFQRSVKDLARGGGLILASSCGLYRPGFLDRMKLLYNLADTPPDGADTGDG